MRRLAVAVSVFLFVSVSAIAQNTRNSISLADVPDLPQCRGILSQVILDIVNGAVEDPATTFEKERGAHAGTIRMPAPIECASKLWQVKHASVVLPKTTKHRSLADRADRKARSGKSPTAAAAGKRLAAPSLSPDGKRAVSGMSRLGGQPPLAVTGNEAPYTGPPVDHRPVMAVRTPPLRKVRPIPPPHPGEDGVRQIPEPIRPTAPSEVGAPEPAHQSYFGAQVSAPTPTGLSFNGVGVGLAGFTPSSNPPDVNGRVGATQYVQWNNTSFAIWDKSGNLLYGPAAGNTLFQSLGGACASHNDGDPVVAYDILAGRWVLSQFVVGASPNFSHQCVAVSTTQDATGEYYLYDFVTDPTNFVDYPHIGVWPDGYYMSSHVFTQAGAQLAGRVSVFEREKMIAGLPARLVQKDLGKDGPGIQYGFLPADLDSLTPPPAGEAAFVLGPNAQFTNRTDSTRVAVTWGATPTITLTEAVISTVGISSPPCVNNTAAQDNRDCVPQPSPAVGADYLDNISFHYMYRLAYRNFGGTPVQESLVVSAPTAGSASTPGHGAIRWFEFRNAGNSTATPTVFQSGTYDPDTSYRWLPSIAMDKDHNIALGYSKSSTSIKPGIYMTGRLGTDAVNTMGAETTVFAGPGVQLAGGNRWGDYSAMTLDPIDQCTFWYTNEFLPNNGEFNWSTRIATYRFPSCTSAPAWGSISGTISSCATGAPLSGVVVTLSNGFAGASDASGHYSISVPAGIYTATAADADRNCSTGSPATTDVSVTSGGTATQDFCMTGSSNLQFNGVTIDDATAGNNNGVINSNECVNVNVAVKNNGCANESAIAATLTTSTTGVTVTQGSATYPDMVIDAGGTNAVPFKIQTSNTFVCGTIIDLTLNLTYASGNKSIGLSLPTCAGGPSQTIPTSSIALTDLTQTDRMGRDGVPSTCGGKACPQGIGTAGTRNYKTFNFTNSGGAPACITVQIDAACGSGGGAGDIESAAYLNTYNPANLCANFLGDSGVVGLGTTIPSNSYSFSVPASSNFVVVINTNTGSTTCAQFSGLVSGFFDFTQGPGACPGCTPPATPTATNGGPYCESATISLFTPTVAGATYAWTGPNGFTSSLQNPTRANATVADAGTYSVTVTVNGCTSAAGTTSVVVNPTPATPTASNGGPYCAGATIALSTPTVAGATYAWSGPNGFTSSLQNPTRANATAADAGTYSVTVTVNGCASAAGTTSVVVNPIPATPTASNGGPYCQGQTISLSTPTVAGATYAWTGANGFTSSLQNPTRTGATLADAGTYSVTVTVNGCTSAAGTTNVVVNAIPATPTANNGGPYCEGATLQLSTPTVAGATYAWTGPNGFTSNQQNPTRTGATLADAGTYSVAVTVNGCTSAAGTTLVTVNPLPPTPTITAGGTTTFCTGGSVTLTSSSGSGNQWYFDGNPIDGAAGDQYVAMLAGSYTVRVTDGNGCASAPSNAIPVVLNPIPATPAATNGGPYQTGDTIELFTPTVTGASHLWSGPNGFTSTDQNPTILNAVLANGGTYSVTITVSGCTSGSGTTDVVVTQANRAPVLTPIGNKSLDEGSLLNFTVVATDDDHDTLTYSVTNLPSGATFDTSTGAFSWMPGYDAAGEYTVTFGVTDGHGGSASETIVITANDTNRPPALDPIGDHTVAAGSGLSFTVSATDPDGDTVTYAALSLPSGATFNTTTGAFSWTPAVPQIGVYGVTFSANDGNGGSTSEAIAINVTTVSPTAVAAIAASTTNVTITWLASPAATSYEILRRAAGGGYVTVGTSSSLQFFDGTVAASQAYLYIVNAVDADGNHSPDSAPDLATTVMFSEIVRDETPVRASDFYELRLAVSAVRALAGLPAASFTDASLEGVAVRKQHIEDLRTALSEALSQLLLPPAMGYTDPTMTQGVTPIKVEHVLELRAGVM